MARGEEKARALTAQKKVEEAESCASVKGWRVVKIPLRQGQIVQPQAEPRAVHYCPESVKR